MMAMMTTTSTTMMVKMVMVDDDDDEGLDDDDSVAAPRAGQAFVGLCVSVRQQLRAACRRALSQRRLCCLANGAAACHLRCTSRHRPCERPRTK